MIKMQLHIYPEIIGVRVEMHMSIDDGKIETDTLIGRFVGNEDIAALFNVEMLEPVLHDRVVVEENW